MSAAEFLCLLLAGVLGTLPGTGLDGDCSDRSSQPEVVRIGLVQSVGDWGEQLRIGAEAGVRDWNRARASVRLELVTLPPSAPWRGEGRALAEMIVRDGVVALIGPADDANAHLTAQVATRLRVPIVTLSSEASLTAAGDPWIFRTVPTDEEQMRSLLDFLKGTLHGDRIAVVLPDRGRGASERAVREREAALARGLRGLEITVVERRENPAAVLLWCDVEEALEVLDRATTSGLRVPLLGSARLDRPEFLSRAADRGAVVYLPLLHAPGVELAMTLGRDCVEAVGVAAETRGASASGIREGLRRGLMRTGRGEQEQPKHEASCIWAAALCVGRVGRRNEQAALLPPGGASAHDVSCSGADGAIERRQP